MCDALVIGEGEHALLKIAQGNSLNDIEGVMSLFSKANHQLVFNKGIQLNLDSLPTPDYTDIPLKEYIVHKNVNASDNIQAVDDFTQAGINMLAMLLVGVSDEEYE